MAVEDIESLARSYFLVSKQQKAVRPLDYFAVFARSFSG